MIKFLILIFLFYILFLKIYETLKKYYENYKNNKKEMHFFKVKLSNNDKTRKKGLMNIKKRLKNNEGMLFDFKDPQIISLWMKNTFIPLDVLYFNENKQIKEMKENMKPKNLNSYKTKNKYKYALEINGGTIKKKNIQLGDFVNLEKIKKLS